MTAFVDHVKIYVKAGDGGRGCVSFRREWGIPRGGPDGGDGGKGGDIRIRADARLNTLLDQVYHSEYRARHGEHGRGKNQNGRNSPDVVIRVPVGTVVRDAETQELLVDLVRDGQEAVVARGGRGGRGNAAFATATRQAPRFAQPGEPGEERWLLLELKLLADVGLIGLPNAGKSTLLASISAARPKIAAYPFTTLTPNLGVVQYRDAESFVVADIPGLIEGAHRGVGLGDRFLRHVERTCLLVHLVDVSPLGPEDPVAAMRMINRELAQYHKALTEKPQVVVATKGDAQVPARREALARHCREQGIPFFALSAVTREGLEPFLAYLAGRVRQLRQAP